MKDGILGIILGAHALWARGDRRGYRANLRDASLRDASLRGADLSDASLRGASLRGADLRRANLSGADLSRANLRGADLRRANLSGADLSDADLRGADLRRANLSGADLSDADLSGADLRGADLRDADLRYLVGGGSPDMTCLQDRWNVCMTKDVMAIGCQQHNVDAWWQFSDEQISAMDSQALGWWRTHKKILQKLYAAKWGVK